MQTPRTQRGRSHIPRGCRTPCDLTRNSSTSLVRSARRNSSCAPSWPCPSHSPPSPRLDTQTPHPTAVYVGRSARRRRDDRTVDALCGRVAGRPEPSARHEGRRGTLCSESFPVAPREPEAAQAHGTTDSRRGPVVGVGRCRRAASWSRRSTRSPPRTPRARPRRCAHCAARPSLDGARWRRRIGRDRAEHDDRVRVLAVVADRDARADDERRDLVVVDASVRV